MSLGSPPVIDDSMAKQAVEPGIGRLWVTELMLMCQGLCKPLLEQILGQAGVVNAPLHKGQKLRPLVEQVRHRVQRGHVAHDQET